MSGKKCWNCGKATMENDVAPWEGWLKCPKCGATYNPKPTILGAPTMHLERDIVRGISTYSPTPFRRKKHDRAGSSQKAQD